MNQNPIKGRNRISNHSAGIDLVISYKL